MKLLNRLIDRLQATFPPNRIVVLLTPIVFVPASAWAAAWIAEHFPGVNLPAGVIAGFAGAAAVSALTLGYKWLDGWQAHEQIDFVGDLEETADEVVDQATESIADLATKREHFEQPETVPKREKPYISE